MPQLHLPPRPGARATDLASTARRPGRTRSPLAIGDRLVLVAERGHGDERPEHLFAAIRARSASPRTTRRLHVAAAAPGRRARAPCRPAAPRRPRRAPPCSSRAPGRGACAEVSGPISVAASSGLPSLIDAASLRKPLEELVGDRLVQDQPRAGDAGLALVVEDRERRAVDRRRRGSRPRTRCWRPCRRARAARASGCRQMPARSCARSRSSR